MKDTVFTAEAAREMQKVIIQQTSDKQVEAVIAKIKTICAEKEANNLRIRSDSINSLTRQWFIDKGYKVEYAKVGTHPPTAYTDISW